MQLWIYRHYKGNEYKVIDIAKDSETLEDVVVYQALYDSPEFWDKALRVRPLKMFEEEVEVDGKSVKRFTLIK